MRDSRASLVGGERKTSTVRRRRHRLRTYLVAGALVSVPTYVTLWVFYRFFLSLEGVLSLIPGSWEVHGLEIRDLLTAIPGLGALLTILCVVVVGYLTTNFVGRRLVRLTEWLITRLPVLSTIYQSVKQLMTTALSGDETRFSDVVLVEYPRQGVWSLGFKTGPAFQEACRKIGRPCVNVFVPTTPNPTSGFYLVIPEDDAIKVAITVEQAFKLIMSAGLVSPDDHPEP